MTDRPIPTAREVAELPSDWRSVDGRDLHTYLTDEIGAEARDRVYAHARYYIAARSAVGGTR
jgi:hypothetical protein